MPKQTQGRQMSYDLLNSTAQDAAIAKVAAGALCEKLSIN